MDMLSSSVSSLTAPVPPPSQYYGGGGVGGARDDGNTNAQVLVVHRDDDDDNTAYQRNDRQFNEARPKTSVSSRDFQSSKSEKRIFGVSE